jgi:gamma-butyrobetaine dioxygenase
MGELGRLARLEREGFFLVPAGELDTSDLLSPWAFAERLVGALPRMVERQIIRPIDGGRSFASNDRETPLHNDLQLFLGAPADLQVMVCVRPAARGGESILVDTWPLALAIAEADPQAFEALFAVERRFPFIAGTLTSPTIARFGDRVSFVHTPRIVQGDELAARVTGWLAERAPRRIALRAGETLVVDNHRVLHGRTAFDDPRRELVRLLVWLREPRAVPERIVSRARSAAVERPSIDIQPEVEDELGLVLRMLAGGSPGGIAARLGVPEPRLYELRDLVLSSALDALARRRQPR